MTEFLRSPKKVIAVVVKDSLLAGTDLPLTEIAGLRGVVRSEQDRPAFKIELTYDDLKSVACSYGSYSLEHVRELFKHKARFTRIFIQRKQKEV